MILLRTFAADSNPAGASSFCSFQVPVGVQNGDLAIVGITLPAAGITVTPPDSSWTQIAQTDPSQSLGVVAFYSLVLNPPANWVFALSSSVQAAGCCAVYANVDSFAPVDASVTALTASSATHNVGAATASLPGEELVLFLGAGASGTYTPAGNYQEVARKQQANATMELQQLTLQNAGAQAGFTETFSATTAGASLLVSLVPSTGTLSINDAYNRFLSAMPQGIDDVLDFTPGLGDFWKLFTIAGSIFKIFAFDLIDIARQEVVPYLTRYKLPDWERFFGLQQTRTALTGTAPQRQQQVLGAFRAGVAKSGSIPTVQSVLSPLLGYFPTTPVQIIEADASALRLAHSYGFASDVSLPGGTATTQIVVSDGGKCSQMGVQLELAFSGTNTTSYTVTLTGPDGTSATWFSPPNGWPLLPVRLYAQSFAGAKIEGAWTLTVVNGSGFANTLYASSVLLVDGTARGQKTGGAIFEWGIYADPAHLGENGTPADLGASLNAIKTLSLSHTVGRLLTSLHPLPHKSSGVNAAIPGRCIPSKRSS